VAAAVALGVLSFGLAASEPADAETQEVTAYFPSAISVYSRGSVKVLGLSAGKVTKVEVQGTRVMVKMRMDSDVPLPENVQATIVPSSLIGERYIQLFPAWTEGTPKAPPKLVIPIERTSVPVEPDEALAALKRLLDSLDPDATGRLVKNLAEDLDGQGQNLSSALSGLSRLTRTLADKDDQIAGIIDNVDRLTTTLRTREAQLGSLIDSFARTASLLAQERQQLEQLLKGLGTVSVDAYELIRSNRVDLQDDLNTVSRLLVSVSANLDSIKTLLEAGPVLVAGRDLDGRTEGLLAAYDPTYHLLDLRTAVSPLVGNAIGRILAILGLPATAICLPIDVTCTKTAAKAAAPASPAAPAAAAAPAPAAAPATAAPAAARPAGAPATTAPAPSTTVAHAPPRTPIDGILDLLGGGRVKGQSAAPPIPVAPPQPASGPGAWLRRAARTTVEALS
jgi:virulence factor Mce-like protein